MSIPTILPGSVFTLASLTEQLGLKRGTLPREIRNRRLRAAKRAGRYFVLGEWVLEWLAGGEVKRRQPELNGTLTH